MFFQLLKNGLQKLPVALWARHSCSNECCNQRNKLQTVTTGFVEKFNCTSKLTVLNIAEIVHNSIEFFNFFELPGVPSYKLWLKVRMVIMFLRNLFPPKLCNRTLLDIKLDLLKIIKATILCWVDKMENVFIPRTPIIPIDLTSVFMPWPSARYKDNLLWPLTLTWILRAFLVYWLF